ncbi:MAG: response regulator [Cyanobacteria bacterium Co-bin13]|nr:response regulator [Cyanobacteria bacterium Co-bin13]
MSEPPIVLVVDDDADNLQLACYIVEQAGYTALGAGSGKDALAQAQEHDVHLVLLDIVLPDMDGFQVIKQLRQQPLGRPTPVVALTALASELERQQIIEAGFSGFLCKPYAIDDLEATLSQYCPHPFSGKASLHSIAS